jgi:nucleolin
LKLFRENFFQECGEVVDVRLANDEDGRFKGFGHIEFATAEAARSVSFYHLPNFLE